MVNRPPESPTVSIAVRLFDIFAVALIFTVLT
jgi:hypothetical protein